MSENRPDLTTLPADVVAYIEALEATIERLQGGRRKSVSAEPSEPPTTLNLITATPTGMVKRTPRHLYLRQRRSGKGQLDFEPASGAPALLTVVDESGTLLIVTNLGRVFRLPVLALPAEEHRSSGHDISSELGLLDNERLVSILPADANDYLILVSQRGRVQRVRANYVGTSLLPGMKFHNPKEGGFVTAACWAGSDDELFIATRQGKAIRFLGRQVHNQGTLGLRVEPDDETVAVSAVTEESGVLLVGYDGKGTIRLMSGFRANKAPGAGGKVALKTDELVAAVTVDSAEDVFIVSQSGQLIRFQAEEIPPKEGVVQGVNCMGLRNDKVTGATVSAVLSD